MDSGKSEPQENSPRDGPIDTEHSKNSAFPSEPLRGSGIPIMDPDLRALVEEYAFQALTEGPLANRTFKFSDESLMMEESEFLSLTFPEKLWKIVESDQFKSVWWNEDGTCIVINVEQFKEEVLERESPIRIFETDCVKSFLCQLNLYGFHKIRQDLEMSASLGDFLMEDKNTLPLRKLQLYYNPNFKRDHPHLISRMKRQVGVKNTPNHPFLPSQNRSKNFLKGNRCKRGRKSTPTGKFAKKRSVSSSASDSSASTSSSATTSSATSFPSTSREKRPKNVESDHVSEQPASRSSAFGGGFPVLPFCVGGTPQARLNQFISFHLAQLVDHPQLNMQSTNGSAATAPHYHAIQTGSFQSMVYPTTYPELADMQAQLTSLLPFYFSILMLAAVSAISTSMSSQQQQSSQYQHCPSCRCSSSNNVQSSKQDPRGK